MEWAGRLDVGASQRRPARGFHAGWAKTGSARFHVLCPPAMYACVAVATKIFPFGIDLVATARQFENTKQWSLGV